MVRTMCLGILSLSVLMAGQPTQADPVLVAQSAEFGANRPSLGPVPMAPVPSVQNPATVQTQPAFSNTPPRPAIGSVSPALSVPDPVTVPSSIPRMTVGSPVINPDQPSLPVSLDAVGGLDPSAIPDLINDLRPSTDDTSPGAPNSDPGTLPDLIDSLRPSTEGQSALPNELDPATFDPATVDPATVDPATVDPATLPDALLDALRSGSLPEGVTLPDAVTIPLTRNGSMTPGANETVSIPTGDLLDLPDSVNSTEPISLPDRSLPDLSQPDLSQPDLSQPDLSNDPQQNLGDATREPLRAPNLGSTTPSLSVPNLTGPLPQVDISGGGLSISSQGSLPSVSISGSAESPNASVEVGGSAIPTTLEIHAVETQTGGDSQASLDTQAPDAQAPDSPGTKAIEARAAKSQEAAAPDSRDPGSSQGIGGSQDGNSVYSAPTCTQVSSSLQSGFQKFADLTEQLAQAKTPEEQQQLERAIYDQGLKLPTLVEEDLVVLQDQGSLDCEQLVSDVSFFMNQVADYLGALRDLREEILW